MSESSVEFLKVTNHFRDFDSYFLVNNRIIKPKDTIDFEVKASSYYAIEQIVKVRELVDLQKIADIIKEARSFAHLVIFDFRQMLNGKKIKVSILEIKMLEFFRKQGLISPYVKALNKDCEELSRNIKNNLILKLSRLICDNHILLKEAKEDGLSIETNTSELYSINNWTTIIKGDLVIFKKQDVN